jgi:aryl-alcohol dehydrogenase-like predicted oxidoreductase
MQDLIDEGKIRGWGLCNDNAYGLAACTRTAKGLGVTPPCSIQGDFSLIDRKVRAVWVTPKFLNSTYTELKCCHS